MAVEAFAGRYEPSHELTRAGSVVVHAAQDRWLHRPVAVAVHDPEVSSADGTCGTMSRSRFQRLGRMLMRVAHPNIADAYDAGRHGSTLFVAFERTPRVLASEMTSRAWDEAEVARLAAELTAALDVVHRQGICLDWLHPGCVGLSADGRVRLAPWPLAAPPEGWGGDGAWLAPERIAGGAPSIPADVWSAGAVVLSAMVGSGPGRLDDDAVAELGGRIKRTRDPVLVSVTARSLRREPADRFDSAAAMAAALDPAADPGTPGDHEARGMVVPMTPRVRTRPLRVPAPRIGPWGWRAAAAVIAGLCVPFLALQLESAPPSVASCRPGSSHHGACPDHNYPADGPALTAAPAPAEPSEVRADAVGTGTVTLAAAPSGPPASAVASTAGAMPHRRPPAPAPRTPASGRTQSASTAPPHPAAPAAQPVEAHGTRAGSHDRGSHGDGLGPDRTGPDR